MQHGSLTIALIVGTSIPLAAQSFNLDVQEAGSPYGLPSSSYGGAAASAGVWMEISSPMTPNLIAIDGSTTGVTLTYIVSSPYFQNMTIAGTSGDDEALLDDCLRAVDTRWRFEGLLPGHYRVYSEALAVDALGWMYTRVTGSLQQSDYRLFADWTGSYAHTVSYTVQDVFVTNGTLLLHHFPQEPLHDDASTSGIQLVLVDAPGGPFCTCHGFSPCQNGTGELDGCTNSTGVGANLLGTGSASVSADDLRFIATDLRPNHAALLFVGNNETNGGFGSWFGDGLMCVAGGIVRLELKTASAAGTAFFGPGLGVIGGWGAGDTRRFQVWYRDPMGPCNLGWNLTNGYAVPFAP
jgi:hypothetical protein